MALAHVHPPAESRLELWPLGGGESLAGGRSALGVCQHLPVRVDDDGARARADGGRVGHLGELVGGVETDEVGDPPRQNRRVGDDVGLELGGRPPVDVEGERNRKRDDDGGEQVGRRENQAGPERHGASSRKPTPRTVWMYRGAAGSSPSFLRSALTWTSSVFVEPNHAGSQTSRTSSSRFTSLPACSRRTRSSSNSFTVSSSASPALRCLVRVEIHAQVAGRKHGSAYLGALASPAEDGADAGGELGRAERLRHVVVRPQLEPEHAVHLLAPGREHDHRRP